MPRILSLAVTTLFISLGAAACNDEFRFAPDGSSDPATKDLDPAPDLSSPKYDFDFVSSMIDHHQMAVHMAAMCTEKADHEELRELCQDMVASQSAAVVTLQGWLEDWFGISHEPVLSKQHEKQVAELEAADGAAFEILFMDLMIAHHATAVEDAQECSKRAYHEELLELCEGIVKGQSEEIGLMQDWLCEWHDRC